MARGLCWVAGLLRVEVMAMDVDVKTRRIGFVVSCIGRDSEGSIDFLSPILDSLVSLQDLEDDLGSLR